MLPNDGLQDPLSSTSLSAKRRACRRTIQMDGVHQALEVILRAPTVAAHGMHHQIHALAATPRQRHIGRVAALQAAHAHPITQNLPEP